MFDGRRPSLEALLSLELDVGSEIYIVFARMWLVSLGASGPLGLSDRVSLSRPKMVDTCL